MLKGSFDQPVDVRAWRARGAWKIERVIVEFFWTVWAAVPELSIAR